MRRILTSALALALLAAFASCRSGDTTTTRSHGRAPTPSPTAATPAPPPTTAPCTPDPALAAPPAAVPPDLALALQRFTTDPRVTANRFGLSISIDGIGEVGAYQPDLPLLPASNQKLLMAMGVLAVLGPDARFTTQVRSAPDGNLVIVAGGDPSLTARGPNSLEALAAQVRAAGITAVPGALVVDDSRYDTMRRAAGWQDWQFPAYVGPLSALMVDRNRDRRDPAFVADPAVADAELLHVALAAHGVHVAGPTVHGSAPDGSTVVASLTSAPASALLTDTLMRSDNTEAEGLLKEVGHSTGTPGSTQGGLAATRAALKQLCVPLAGADDDGSGLSRANGRSAREWRELLQAARAQPWWPQLRDALPVAGRSGTLASRFRGTAAEGSVHAKTGTIIGGIALSGYGTTAGGRGIIFSVLVNGDRAAAAEKPLDALIAAVAAHQG
ncbi:MAG TPA: D-alanyl-D-alanine carboxypeptidase/D-alanyl-D-alanine-endopeptidase [Acidimicrobiia bacterium]|nr:D-alanyl-D-alanine carboxypeptidase/D-alanyl-D-alanine-endopeptidase [Acidimicrobiia bacterium]